MGDMFSSLRSKFRDLDFDLLLLGGTIASLLWSLYFSVVAITIPYQIELREGAAQVTTRLLLNGENPFTLEYLPMALNVYGIGYHLAVLPFAAMFGSTLAVHRSVTLAAIFLAAAVVFAAIYKTKKEVALALAGSAFVIVALIGRAGNGAFSSALGAFLFYAAVIIPFLRNFDARGLALSAVVALAAFYTKPYYVLSFGVVASYVFLFVSKKRGLGYALFFLGIFTAAFFAVKAVFPTYFFNVIIANTSMSWLLYSHMLAQLSVLFLYFYPVLFLSIQPLAAALRGFAASWSHAKRGLFLNIRELSAPLAPQHRLDYNLYIFACAFVAFAFVLGRHMGNYMNYAYQLLVPSFFCWFFQSFDFKNNWRKAAVLLTLFSLFIWQRDLLSPSMLEQKNSEDWATLFSYIRSSSNVLNSQADVSEVVRLGLTPIDTGQTIVFYQIKPYPDSYLTDVSYEAIVADGTKYVNFVDRSIQKKNFDLIIVVREKAVFYHIKRLRNYYDLVDMLDLDMPQSGWKWTAEVWKPKK